MPPDGLHVDTKIDDEKGVRNEQSLYFLNGLWWTGEGSDAMYVYYNPTHWKRDTLTDLQQAVIEHDQDMARLDRNAVSGKLDNYNDGTI